MALQIKITMDKMRKDKLSYRLMLNELSNGNCLYWSQQRPFANTKLVLSGELLEQESM